VVVIQSDALIQSRVSTAICVSLTNNLKWALEARLGNVNLSAGYWITKRFRREVSQIISLDKSFLRDRLSQLPRHKLELLFSGVDLVLGKLGLIANPACLDTPRMLAASACEIW
jgi:mRNA interferase MazF